MKKARRPVSGGGAGAPAGGTSGAFPRSAGADSRAPGQFGGMPRRDPVPGPGYGVQPGSSKNCGGRTLGSTSGKLPQATKDGLSRTAAAGRLAKYPDTGVDDPQRKFTERFTKELRRRGAEGDRATGPATRSRRGTPAAAAGVPRTAAAGADVPGEAAGPAMEALRLKHTVAAEMAVPLEKLLGAAPRSRPKREPTRCWCPATPRRSRRSGCCREAGRPGTGREAGRHARQEVRRTAAGGVAIPPPAATITG